MNLNQIRIKIGPGINKMIGNNNLKNIYYLSKK